MDLSADVRTVPLNHFHVEVLVGELVLATSMELGGMGVEDTGLVPGHQTLPMRAAPGVTVVARLAPILGLLAL